MRCLARTRLGLLGLGLALVAPSGVGAQQYAPAPAGGQTPSAAPIVIGLDGQPVAATAAPAAGPHHAHRGRTLCASCARKQEAMMMPPPRIIACAHSKNGVCTACQAALAMPGEMTVMGAPAVADAPGRAVASSGPASGTSSANVAGRTTARSSDAMMAPYDGPSADPAPIGVVQANFSQSGPNAMPAAYAGQSSEASQPGRAVVSSGAGQSPYAPRSNPFPRPHIIRHLLGFEGWLGGEGSEDRRRKKAEAHAMIPYNNEGTTVNDIPASMVYGRR